MSTHALDKRKAALAESMTLKEAAHARRVADVKRFNDGTRTLDEVAAMAGVPRSTVRSIILRAGLPKPKNARQT